MTVEEIFTKICTHMAEGVQFHEELKKAYCFLGLYGYATEKEKHYKEELHGYNKLVKYYMKHYFKLLKIDEIQKPTVIPDNWYKYSSQAVDAQTKRNAIKELIIKWIEWEKDTKKLYEEMYLELTNLKEIAMADYFKNFICNVNEELTQVQKKLIKLESVNYDMVFIAEQQKK